MLSYFLNPINFYYRATETQVTKVEDNTEKTDESAVPDDIKTFYQKIDEEDDDEEESKGFIYRTRAIISRSRFEAALVYKPRILGPTFLVYVLK